MKSFKDLQYNELGGFLIFMSVMGVMASVMVLTRTWYASTPRLVTIVSLGISVFNMAGWYWVADDLRDQRVSRISRGAWAIFLIRIDIFIHFFYHILSS